MDADLTGASYGGSMAGAIGQAGNSHVHCGALVLAALIGIVALHLLGFRFAIDAGVGR